MNGTQWVRSCNLKPGQNILVALLKLPRLDVFSKDISFHSILHYTIDEVNLQTPAISTVLNANQLLGNELLPKFKDQKICKSYFVYLSHNIVKVKSIDVS